MWNIHQQRHGPEQEWKRREHSLDWRAGLLRNPAGGGFQQKSHEKGQPRGSDPLGTENCRSWGKASPVVREEPADHEEPQAVLRKRTELGFLTWECHDWIVN